ncbi:MAG: DNA repair protein RecN [Gammaproteobacteria bacterium]
MLQQIRVKDYAIIDEAELELGGGLTVLTGETGAGKSILIDALGLVLGDRADASAVRQGASRAEITAFFDLGEREDVSAWVKAQEMDADGECVLRRVVSREGRSRGFINGCPVPMQTLRSLGEMMVEIHGQHEHQHLTRRATQRELLDSFGAHLSEIEAVRETATRVGELGAALEALRAARADRDSRLDLLRYQSSELEALALEDGEPDRLESEHLRLANTGRLAEGADMALDLIFEAESGAAQQRLARSSDALAQLADLDPALEPIRKLVEEAEIQTSEAADGLRRYLADLDMDPARLEFVSNRLAEISKLARKHQTDPAALPGRLRALTAELEALQDDEVALRDREQALGAATRDYAAAAAALSKRRQSAAAELSEQVSAMMRQLGMPGGRFEVQVDADEQARVSINGRDRIEFLVAANPGQTPGVLAKVASGGELSRISLAIQVVATAGSSLPCLVFDEVDSGVGGGVAEIVGRRLRELGDGRQVLCVTHLPQVASQSHHHVRISKLSTAKATRTTLNALNDSEKIEELARMLGGVEITSTTREHAREMIQQARNRA